jgi:flagellar hook-length control protein FliK
MGAADALSRPSTSRSAAPAALLHRIVEAVPPKAAFGTRLRIALTAESLGELVVELSVQGGLLRGRVIVDTDSAREALSPQLDRLRSSLGARGIRVGVLEVVVGDPPDVSGPPRRGRLDILA